jgi:pimeloyl-ACP methyl ester carboxylesterase
MPVSQVVDELERYYSGLLAAEGLVGLRPSDEMKKAIGTITSLDGLGGFTPDAAGALPKIKAGTLIIWGSEDRVVPVSYAEEFKNGISGSVLRVLAGAGHLPFVEKPEEVNALTISFLG